MDLPLDMSLKDQNWLSETGGRINLEDESEESDCSSVDLEAVSPSNEKLISPKKVTTSK